MRSTRGPTSATNSIGGSRTRHGGAQLASREETGGRRYDGPLQPDRDVAPRSIEPTVPYRERTRPAGAPPTGPRTRDGMEPVTTPTGKPRREQPRHRPSVIGWVARPLSWLGFLVLGISLATVLVGGMIWLRLLYDSMPLRFLVDPIRQALSSELDGLDVAIQDAVLHRIPSGAVELRLKALRIQSAERGPLIDAEEAVVGLDTSSLWMGRLAASRIVLIGSRLAIVADGPEAGRAGDTAGSVLRGAVGEAVPVKAAAPGAPASLPGGGAAIPLRLDMARVLREAIAHVRRAGEGASHLRSVGLRDASVSVVAGGTESHWSVPELSVDLDHRQKRSLVSGRGRLAAGGEPFSVEFSLEDSDKARAMRLLLELRGVQPKELARQIPALAGLAVLDVPVTARGELELLPSGEVGLGRIDAELGRGALSLAAAGGPKVPIDQGTVALVCRACGSEVDILPSRIQHGQSFVQLKGSLKAQGADRGRGWQLKLESLDGGIGFGSASGPLALEQLALVANVPERGGLEIASFIFKAAGAEIVATGSLGGAAGGSAIEGRIGPMPIQTVHALWPSGLAVSVRDVLSRSLLKGDVKGGTFRLASADAAGTGGQTEAYRAALAIEAENLVVALGGSMPQVAVPRALLNIQGNALELSLPDAHLGPPGPRRMTLKGLQLSIPALDQPRPVAELSGRALAPVAVLVDLAQREPVSLIKLGQAPSGLDGKAEIQWRAFLPLIDGETPADARYEVKAKVTEGRIADAFGSHDLTGGAFNVVATEKAIDLKGEMLLAGILAKASGQWIMGEARDRQAPLVISSRLDNADRRLLGLGVDDLVLGEVPIEVQVSLAEAERPRINVLANLTAAELMLDGLAWKKPAGQSARLAFEVVKRQSKGMELQGFKLTGDGIAIDGSVVIGPDGSAQSYRFPGFSLNVVTNLEVEAQRAADRTWEVKARGKTFDGGELMRSLYAIGAPDSKKTAAKKDGGLDLDAQIDTVLGLNDTNVRQIRLKMRRVGDAMKSLRITGVLDGNHPIDVSLRPESAQPRTVHVTTSDAGQALKMIGIYHSMAGGKGDLWINLDGRGTAEREGRIRVAGFRILGDPIVNELISGTDDSRPAIAAGAPRGQRRVAREEILFDHLNGAFATGNGQVVLESLTAAGPLMGASVRGKLDFRSRSLALGGTYVPLSGLNRALSEIPIVGQILTGPKGDGIFGITFAVDGSMSQPNVIVNPLSIVAPGVLREIFQMAPDNLRVTPTLERAKSPPAAGARVKASEPATSSGVQAGTHGGAPRIIEGWSSETTQPKRRN